MTNKIQIKTFEGLQNYHQSIKNMEETVLNVIAGKEQEQVWLLEYNNLITKGTSTKQEDIINKDKLPIYESQRGGRATYHGKGQRIIYPILKLENRGKDIRGFVTRLETWVSLSLKEFGIECFTCPERVGIWVKKDNKELKIGAIGLRVKKWVSYHGIAININPDLSKFNNIVPCGIKEHGVTSLADLGVNINFSDFDKALLKHLNTLG